MSGIFGLFIMFFRIGIFGFGGGLAMLPLVFQSVQVFGVMSHEEFSTLVALSQVVPGAIIINAATYVGYSFAGIPGAVAAVFGVATPSFIMVLTAMYFLKKFKESKVLQGVLFGIRPAVVGLIAAASVFIAKSSLLEDPLIPCLIFACTVVLIGKFKISPIIIMLCMGAIGAFTCG